VHPLAGGGVVFAGQRLEGFYVDLGSVFDLAVLRPFQNFHKYPMAAKDLWNSVPPTRDGDFAKYVEHPEHAALLPVLYPGVFPNLAAYSKPRADLAALLLTGIPGGIVPGFQNFTGNTPADVLRLNRAIPLFDPSFAPDRAVSALTQGFGPGLDRYISNFPCLGVPGDGYHTPAQVGVERVRWWRSHAAWGRSPALTDLSW
jgi:Domain of unknown function (DUF4331)